MDAMTPLPGDPSGLLARANDLSRAAEEIQRAIQHLHTISNRDETISKAVDAVRSDTKEVAANVTKAHVRYSGTASALREYAPKLEAAQQRAHRAINAYHTATADVTAAEHRLHDAKTSYVPDDGSTPPNTFVRDAMFAGTPEGARRQHAVHDAQAEITAAQNDWWAAVSDMTSAAKHAAGLIDAVMDAGGLNDSFWDQVGADLDAIGAWCKKYLGPIFDVLQKIAAEVGQIAGMLALIVGVLGVFFPALEGLAAVLEVISLVASVLSFALTLALTAMGDRTWGDVLSTGIVAVTACLGMSGAFGRIGSIVGSKIESSVVGGVVGRVTAPFAGQAAVEAGEQGATFVEQSVVANLIQGSMVDDIYATVADHVVDELVDPIASNAGGGLDGLTGQEEPAGLWTAPPSVLPEFNFTDPHAPMIEPGLFNPPEFINGLVESYGSLPSYIVGATSSHSSSGGSW